ncbi:MAG TPA: hypothetical protein VFI23_16795, partial [Rhizomicrobium sp.]|nr:hypothetical protein [Rhizomicrobium sp.]
HDGSVFAHERGPNALAAARRVSGPPVAFNVQDRYVISGNVSVSSVPEIFVITSAGDVFAHQYNENLGGVPSVGPATKLAGPPVASHTQDRWVFMSGGHIVVIREEGGVFIHDVS